MIYELKDGTTIDTDRDLNFDERNFLQKMLIFKHLKFGIEDFRAKWRVDGNPVWKGPATLEAPSPLAKIMLDMEKRIASGD